MENIRRFVRLATRVKRVTRRYVVSQLFLVGMVVCNLFIPRPLDYGADALPPDCKTVRTSKFYGMRMMPIPARGARCG